MSLLNVHTPEGSRAQEIWRSQAVWILGGRARLEAESARAAEEYQKFMAECLRVKPKEVPKQLEQPWLFDPFKLNALALEPWQRPQPAPF